MISRPRTILQSTAIPTAVTLRQPTAGSSLPPKTRKRNRVTDADEEDDDGEEEDKAETTMDVDEEAPRTKKGRKRGPSKLSETKSKRRSGAVDVASKEEGVYLRNRFTAREHDMVRRGNIYPLNLAHCSSC